VDFIVALAPNLSKANVTDAKGIIQNVLLVIRPVKYDHVVLKMNIVLVQIVINSFQ
jgi:hypothetical protein